MVSRKLSEKRIRNLLKYVPDCELDNLLWVVQQYAAAGLNEKAEASA